MYLGLFFILLYTQTHIGLRNTSINASVMSARGKGRRTHNESHLQREQVVLYVRRRGGWFVAQRKGSPPSAHPSRAIPTRWQVNLIVVRVLLVGGEENHSRQY